MLMLPGSTSVKSALVWHTGSGFNGVLEFRGHQWCSVLSGAPLISWLPFRPCWFFSRGNVYLLVQGDRRKVSITQAVSLCCALCLRGTWEFSAGPLWYPESMFQSTSEFSHHSSSGKVDLFQHRWFNSPWLCLPLLSHLTVKSKRIRGTRSTLCPEISAPQPAFHITAGQGTLASCSGQMRIRVPHTLSHTLTSGMFQVPSYSGWFLFPTRWWELSHDAPCSQAHCQHLHHPWVYKKSAKGHYALSDTSTLRPLSASKDSLPWGVTAALQKWVTRSGLLFFLCGVTKCPQTSQFKKHRSLACLQFCESWSNQAPMGSSA